MSARTQHLDSSRGAARLALTVASVLGLALAAAHPATAQTARSGGGASAQLLQQMQQLASERTALQAENAKLQKQLEDLRKERDTLKKGRQAVDERSKVSEAALARSASDRDAAQEELKKTKTRLEELVGKFRETLQQMRDVETEGTRVKQSLAAREQDLKVCTEHNAALYKLDSDVLARLEKESVWSRLATSEPFTKLKRNQLENLADDYRAQADEQRLATPASGGSTPPIHSSTRGSSTTASGSQSPAANSGSAPNSGSPANSGSAAPVTPSPAQ